MLHKPNISELAFDSGILVFSFGLSYYYETLISIHIFSIPFSAVFLLLALYYLPVLIGNLYNNVFFNAGKTVKNLVVCTLATNLLFIFGNLMHYVVSSNALPELTAAAVGISAMVLVIVGPISGLMFTAAKADENKVSVQMYISLIAAGIIMLFVILIFSSAWFKSTWGPLRFFLTIGLIGGDAAAILLSAALVYCIKNFFVKVKVYDPLNRAFRILIPFLAAFLLTVFNIHASRLIFHAIGTDSIDSKMLVLGAFIFSGVLPLRLILAAKPPYNAVNIFIGILSACALLFNVFR